MKNKEREEKRMKEQLGISNKRGETWTGFRPSYMRDKSKYSKASRKSGKEMCRATLRGF